MVSLNFAFSKEKIASGNLVSHSKREVKDGSEKKVIKVILNLHE